MSTKEAFNELVCEFLDDLSSTFVEHQCLELVHTSLQTMLGEDKSTPLPVCVFQSVVGGIKPDDIHARTPVLLETLDCFVRIMGVKIDVKADYESSDKSTKDAIWEYVTNLHAAARSLDERNEVETINMSSVDTIMASVTEMDPANAEAMMQSIMCLVPPGLKEFVDEKVLDCQQKIEDGDLCTKDIVDQIKNSMGQFT